MVFWLLERGADLNQRAYTDITPLSRAVEHASPDLVQDLLDYGGDVSRGEVLYYALERKTDVIPVLKMLLDKGAPLDAVVYEDHGGSFQLNFFFERHTPLCMAADRGDAEAVRLLLERGADPTVQNSIGLTPFEVARREGEVEIADMLAEWLRTHPVYKGVPKIPLLVEGYKLWFRHENVGRDFDNGVTALRVGDSYFPGRRCAVDAVGHGLPGRGNPMRPRRPKKSRGGGGSGSGTESQAAPVAGDDRWAAEVAREVVDNGERDDGDDGGIGRAADSPPATSDDGTDSQHAKEALPVEVDTTPGCFAWVARWKRKRRERKERVQRSLEA